MQVVEPSPPATPPRSPLISAGAPYESASQLESRSCFGAHTGFVSRIPQNAVWFAARYSPMHRPMTILAVTRYGNQAL